MRVLWTAGAADDLEDIADYLFDKTPLQCGTPGSIALSGRCRTEELPESRATRQKSGSAGVGSSVVALRGGVPSQRRCRIRREDFQD